MNSIGERLREERLRRGFTIEQIAESTKINPSLLVAIEADDLERLPGTFFTRSFIRQYAHALGMDAAELEPEIDRVASVEQVPEPEAAVMREAISVPPVDNGIGRSRSPRSLGALASFLLILAACSGLYILWQRSRQAPPAEHPPAPKQVPVAATKQSAPPAPVQAAPQPAQTVAEPPAAPATPSAAPAGQAAQVRIQLRATAVAWIRLVADGKNLFTGTLQPGDARTVEAEQQIQLRTGNAAGIEVEWNGKPFGRLGSEGEVRTLEFTHSGFRVLAPAPAAPPAPKPEPPAAEP
jgi:cytoskeleton protein RodZ